MTTPPLRIALMLESDGPGGAEIVVFQLAEELRRRGHTVFPVGPAEGVGWLGEKFRDAGFDHQTFVERRPPDPFLVRDLARMMRRLEVDVVHSHEFTLAVYGAAAARLVRVPHVISMHGNQTMTDVWRRRAALRWAFRHSHGTVAVSGATKASLDEELGLAPDVVGVLRNGIPHRPGDPGPVRRELGVVEGEVLLLAVGNLDPRKGHMFLLRALQQLREKGLQVPWRLAIAGGRGGPERPKLEAFAAEHGVSDRVHVLAQREDIPDLQAAADVFSMPSLWEGLPLAILEAMLAGNAIVASECSGIPEALTNEEHGLLVPPGDVDALAGALHRLLSDPELRRRLGAAAHERGHAEFTVEVMAGAYEALFRDALARFSAGRRGA